MNNLKFKNGDLRFDGFKFWGYVKKDGIVREHWLSPIAYENAIKRNKKWQKSNLERTRDHCKRWRTENPEKMKQCKKNWIEKNRDKVRKNRRDWKKKNPAKVNATNAKRRVAIKNLTTELNAEEKAIILCIFETSKRISDCCGIQHHVDHIIPVARGGLHHHCNFQIIPATINAQKGTRINNP
jgi:hypothetical protein